MSNSNASASDSANIEITRSPLIYPEPVSMIKAVGKFDCKVERVGGLVETFTAYNTLTLKGKQQLLYGIARTNDHFVGLSTVKTGMYFSLTAKPGAEEATSIDLADYTTATNLTATGGTTVKGGTDIGADVYTYTSNADIFAAGSDFGSTVRTLVSSPMKVLCGAGGSGNIISILICDASTGVEANALVWAGATVAVTLAQDDTLEATYSLSIAAD